MNGSPGRLFDYLDWLRYCHLSDDSYPRTGRLIGWAMRLYSRIHRFTYWHPGWGYGPGPYRTWYTAEDIAAAKDRAMILKASLDWE